MHVIYVPSFHQHVLQSRTCILSASRLNLTSDMERQLTLTFNGIQKALCGGGNRSVSLTFHYLTPRMAYGEELVKYMLLKADAKIARAAKIPEEQTALSS